MWICVWPTFKNWINKKQTNKITQPIYWLWSILGGLINWSVSFWGIAYTQSSHCSSDTANAKTKDSYVWKELIRDINVKQYKIHFIIWYLKKRRYGKMYPQWPIRNVRLNIRPTTYTCRSVLSSRNKMFCLCCFLWSLFSLI